MDIGARVARGDLLVQAFDSPFADLSFRALGMGHTSWARTYALSPMPYPLSRARLRGSLLLLAAPPALVAVALDLAGQVVRGLVDRADHAVRGLARAKCYALEMEGDLRDLRLRRVPRIALLGELHLSQGK